MSEEILWDLWDTMKRNNICITGIPGEKKEKRTESIFKVIMAENFSNLGREMDIQIHEDQRTPRRLNLNKAMLRHIVIKLSKVKDKERILRASREKKEGEFLGNPMVRTPYFHCRGHRFNPWSGKLRSHKPSGTAKKREKRERLHTKEPT